MFQLMKFTVQLIMEHLKKIVHTNRLRHIQHHIRNRQNHIHTNILHMILRQRVRPIHLLKGLNQLHPLGS